MRDAWTVLRGFGAGLCVASVAVACSTDTAGLARRPPSGSEAGGGGGIFAPAAGTGGSGGASEGGSGGAPPVASGPGAVHVVHGLIDGGDLFVCLREVGGAALAEGAPQPEAGVAYGESLRIPTSWDPALDVEALLFVAAGGLVGTSCNELSEAVQSAPDAGANGVDAGAATPVFPLEPVSPRSAGSVRFPPGLLRAGAHYALVAAGCTGPGANEEVCGAAEPLFGSHRAVALAELASELGAGDGSFGLQFFNASRAVSQADVVLQGLIESDSRQLTSDVPFGGVRPRDAIPVDEPIGVELHVDGSLQSSYTQAWADTLAAGGGLTITPGDNYLLVYIGPVPGVSAGPTAPPRFVLLHRGG